MVGLHGELYEVKITAFLLDNLKSCLNQIYVTGLINEVTKCDITFFRKFLSRVKIFHSQSNEETFKGVIEKKNSRTLVRRQRSLRISFTQTLKKDVLTGGKEGGILNGSTIIQDYGKRYKRINS
jgi:methyltransferase-like protein